MKNLSSAWLALLILIFTGVLSAQSTLPALSATADAFTQNGSNNNINVIRVESRAASTRNGYLKFNIPTISGTISKVELKLTIADDWDKDGGAVSVYQGNTNAWTETGINGTNEPSTSGQPLAVRQTNTADRGGAVNIYYLSTDNVERYSGEITFILKYSGSDDDLSYASKEHATVAWRPELLITYNVTSSTDPISSFTATLSGNNDVQLDWTYITDDYQPSIPFVTYSELDYHTDNLHYLNTEDRSHLYTNVTPGKSYRFRLSINYGGSYQSVWLYIPDSTDTEAPEAPQLNMRSLGEGDLLQLEVQNIVDNVGVSEFEIFVNGVYRESQPAISLVFVSGLLDTDHTIAFKSVDAAGNKSDFSNDVVFRTVSDLPWLEDFNNLTNGAISDSGDTAWTSSRDSGSFSVQDGLFEITGNGEFGSWTSEVVSIDETVSISIDINDDDNNQKEGTDFIRAFYVLNGGSPIQFGSVTDDISAQTFSAAGLNGSTLQIIIESKVSFTNEFYYFDNVSIIGETQISIPNPPTNLTFSIPNNNSTTLSWIASTSTGVSGYQLYRNGNLESTLGNVTNIVVNNLSATAIESFKVTAIDGNGNESADSNLVSVDNSTVVVTPPPTAADSYWIKSNNSQDIHYIAGNVGIGTNDPGVWKLAVNGSIRAKEIKVETDWADYVFSDDYNLPSLEEVERHIKEKGHLMNIPSATDVKANGIKLGKMSKLLLEKIEEATLYVLQNEQRIKALETQK